MKGILEFVIKALATGLGLGYMPFAPGTWGTLMGIPLFFALQHTAPTTYLMLTVLFAGISCIIAEFAVRIFGEDDCPKIVIDEIAGFLVTMAWLPVTWQALVGGFVLFRILDALKPGPIGYLDRKIKGGVGVVVDDIAAGILANIILQVVFTQTHWLGAQL